MTGEGEGGRTITVFGGTGFLGRRVVRQLVDAGCRVRVAARHPDLEGFAAEAGQLLPTPVDLLDERSVAAAVEGADGVVNAVSLYVEKGDLTFKAIHVDGAQRLARNARAAGVHRLVHVSGVGVDRNSASAFVRARALGEEAVAAAFEGATIVRPCVMFACDDAFLTSLEKVSRLPAVPLFGRGRTRLQPAHGDDVARAIRQLLTGSDDRPRLFQLGGGRIYRYREAVELVARHLGRRRVFVPVPFPVWRTLIATMKVLPRPPLTRDQLALLETDNVVPPGATGFADLGIQARSLESVLEECYPRGQ